MSANPNHTSDKADLEQRRNALRRQLAQARQRYATLIQRIGPQLRALYQRRFGALELALLQAQADNVRRQRKLELLQTATNGDDRVSDHDRRSLECRLDLELHEWQRRLSQKEDELERMRRFFASDLSEASIAIETAPDERSSAETTTAALAEENACLLRRLRRQLKRTAELKGQEPYCYEARLKDRLWVARRQLQLKEEIEQQQVIAQRLDALLSSLQSAPQADAA